MPLHFHPGQIQQIVGFAENVAEPVAAEIGHCYVTGIAAGYNNLHLRVDFPQARHGFPAPHTSRDRQIKNPISVVLQPFVTMPRFAFLSRLQRTAGGEAFF